MPYNNLPGIFKDEQDGNIQPSTINDNPIVLVLGTAAQGESETVYNVERVSTAARVFGKQGTLTRGLYETSLGGALNIRLFRIGATPARLIDIGSSPGLEIETVRKDDSAGTDYTLFFEASTLRLRVYRASDGELVYDNYPSYPLAKVDLGEVSVTGTITGTPNTDIGTAGTPITLAAADASGNGPAVFTPGTDGLALSRMEMWEALYNAYQLLEDVEADVVVPMNVYLDDLNVMDLTQAEVTSRGLTSLTDYPVPLTAEDVLGKVFVQEYEGVNYFWWWFPADPALESFSVAQIYPSVGSASATTDANGTPLSAADFHEVNFAYQLANYCYVKSRDIDETTGVVGVLPPTSYSLKDVALWVGALPTTTTDGAGNVVITNTGNGTGLLGNKFMSGRVSANGLPGHSIGGVDGLFHGGFIATETGFLDDSQISDDNDHLVDIGKYISVVASYPVLSNPSQNTSYVATGAPTYGGFYSALPPQSAPTNKLLRNVRLPFRVGKQKLDLLAGQRYVTFHAATRGIVVSDAPTAARPDSDYQRLSTVRQVKAAVDSIRSVADPFLGEGMSGAQLAALETAIDSQLKALVKGNVLSRYEFNLTATAQQRVLGQATLELKLVPVFELRQLTIVVGLAAV